ncbi:MAG TPA: DUF4215 domain-containing protein [Candidatus Polarisedimenticolia bacterium]|nr:DUF4215 domain-containing protein [Candidatus Polarisedimenticolia bacterium]
MNINRTVSVNVKICGDGAINQTCETCDTNAFPANAPSSHGACRTGGECGSTSCTFCGDGIVNGGEQCDDGNNIDTDGCRNSCVLPICGDSIVGNTPGETCDPPGNPAGNNGNSCREDCTVCGDAVQQPGEMCDDGNGVDTDGCRNNCTLPICGDSIVGNTPGETCDPPGSIPTVPAGNTNACRPLGDAQCTYCGDNVVNDGEQCDDGNHVDTDGCHNDCTLPSCGDGIINQECETCDTGAFPAGAPSSHGECRTGPCGSPGCTFCGDHIVNGGEECDDGNNIDTDGCHNNCTLPTCGDGIVGNTPGETCDPPGSTPTVPAGNTNTCRPLGDAQCTYCGDNVVNDGEQCDDGNHVDTDGCHNDCTLPSCGDGMINQSGCAETCDTNAFPAGAPSSHGTCRPGPCGNPAACTFCGDNMVNGDEQCDDGNNVDTDGCRNNCTLPTCGDGIVGNTPNETCDPPGTPAGNNGNNCREDCTVCGDGVQQTGEMCDDGNGVDTDGCRNNCTLPTCGDSILGNTPGETCDPPGSTPATPPGNTNVCRPLGEAQCTYCGDNLVNDGEQCDDGNHVDTDGCRNDCTLPSCGDGLINEECEKCDGNAFPASAPGTHGVCRTGPCGTPGCTFCGDGIVNGDEQCDDGNAVDTDGCRNSCTLPSCGDGIVGNSPGETCDPPGAPAGNNGNNCRDNCTVCGDNHVDDGEQCDDGNGVDTDGCRNNCTLPSCGDGLINNSGCGETCDTNTFPGTAPATHGPCRPGPCGQPAACTFCGDGIVNDGEQCDDGNAVDTDSCSNSCTFLECGDGIVGNTPGETCDPPGTPAGGNGNNCRNNCTVCGDNHVDAGEQCDDGNGVDTDGCRNNCTLPGCSVVIAKTVAPDDGSGGGTACDGTADGPFVEAVTVDQKTCVVYQICVTNTGQQVLDGNGVKVSDPVLGTVNFEFGTIAVGAPPVCKLAPGVITAPDCTGGNPAGTSCLCSDVAGVNTATITSAICQANNQDACSQPGSDCSDTAIVACLGPGTCRMTGGHNFDVVDAQFNENGKVYTTGGQIGAPNESGCCDLPPKGKCVAGKCTGGANGGDTCSTNSDCPNDPGRNSHCPWGDWEHNHHSGPDDSGSLRGGAFAFHSGTAASPDDAFIKSVLCADPGWCVQARPAPFKQIFWEGTGVFHNERIKGKDVPLPNFRACGANQPVPYSKDGGTLHYYKAHVSDFGEPAGIFQKPVGACRMDESCTSKEPNGVVEINDCELGDVCLVDSVADPVKTALHPLCLAQTCSDCPDAYEIEIHCTEDPSSPVAYRVSHFIREGNFQLHPSVGDSCNPQCGDGVCDPGATGTAETCQSCPADCCP